MARLEKIDESCNKYFLKKAFDGKTYFVSVFDKDEGEINGTDGVLREVCAFYSELYKEKTRDISLKKELLEDIEFGGRFINASTDIMLEFRVKL